MGLWRTLAAMHVESMALILMTPYLEGGAGGVVEATGSHICGIDGLDLDDVPEGRLLQQLSAELGCQCRLSSRQ